MSRMMGTAACVLVVLLGAAVCAQEPQLLAYHSSAKTKSVPQAYWRGQSPTLSNELPEGLAVADCLILANLRGLSTPADIIIKTRYYPAWAYTNAACASGALGKMDAALGYLRQAIAQGFADLPFLESVPYLEGLRGRREWQELIGELEGKVASS